jgi:hypothetical protein
VIEYECEDCHTHVHAYALGQVPDPPLCVVCAFIRSMDLLPLEEAALRAFLHQDGND